MTKIYDDEDFNPLEDLNTCMVALSNHNQILDQLLTNQRNITHQMSQITTLLANARAKIAKLEKEIEVLKQEK